MVRRNTLKMSIMLLSFTIYDLHSNEYSSNKFGCWLLLSVARRVFVSCSSVLSIGKCYFSGVRDRIRVDRELGVTRACARGIRIEDCKWNILGKHQSDQSHSGLSKLVNRPQLMYSNNIIWDLGLSCT